MIVLETVAELRAWCDDARRAGHTVGVVPTMGFLHEGHRSLMRRARTDNDAVVVTIFVNPTQFAAGEDLSKYPRDLAGDTRASAEEGVDVLFVPTVEAMYPNGGSTSVHVGGVSEGLCGASRPGHFDGVATVVAKLFAIVGPSRAYFGRKDAQQLAVVRRMATDLMAPVEVVGCPIVREPDGLAMSSRNSYLDDEDRAAAGVLSRSLREAADAVVAGARDPGLLTAAIVAAVTGEPRARLDYAVVVDATTLLPVSRVEGDVLIAVAAFVGPARLIDNMACTVTATDVRVDAGVLVAGRTEER